MAISQMAKVLIATHRTEASGLLEALQGEGICHVLNAEEAMVSRDWPELAGVAQRPKDIEELLGRLAKSISFLKAYAAPQKGLASIFSPRAIIDEQAYKKIVSDREILKVIEQCEEVEATIEKAKGKIENLCGTVEMLRPWVSLETPVEEIGELRQTTSLAGLIPITLFEEAERQIEELGGAVELVGTTGNKYSCVIVCLKAGINEVQKLLRSVEFEPANFESMRGTAAQLINEHSEKLSRTKELLYAQYEKAAALAENLFKLEILHDYYTNLLNREQTKGAAPATVQTIILEGWVKEKDYARLEKIVSGFEASSLNKIEAAEGEDVPVEIENKNIIEPFEAITRLYGMPQHRGVDPTIFLAPFFAIFFGVCLGDAGYGLVMIAATALVIKKMQGDKKLVWMLGICAGFTIMVGALTGGWFGDAIQQFTPILNPLREKIMWFDPLQDPKKLLGLSVILGYIHLMSGLVIAFGHNIRVKNYIAAACEQLTWIVMLNSVVIFGLGKAGVVPAEIGRFFGILALVPAALIMLFSNREGGWGERLGMGAYNLFSSVFYIGDVLSYLRLMALGLVSSGLAMSINLMAKMVLKMPYGIGIIIAIIIFVIGHTGNLVLSALGAFVHTMRLQFVEFFPKFLVGGGRPFEPLRKEYKYVYIKNK